MHVGPKGTPSEAVALEFARALASRDYQAAYGMISNEFRSGFTCGDMQADFEAIVPSDWGPVDPIEIGSTMDAWPGKLANDIEWVYVGIGGDMYSEAVVVVVTEEDGALRIREVEWGRP
jgi:hypothetical protein